MCSQFDINGFVSITIRIVNNLLGKVRFKSDDTHTFVSFNDVLHFSSWFLSLLELLQIKIVRDDESIEACAN